MDMIIGLAFLFIFPQILVIYVYSFRYNYVEAQRGSNIAVSRWGSKNKKERKRHRGYFAGAGFSHNNKVFGKSLKLLADRKWIVGLSGVAYRLGSYENENKVALFFLSLPYIPLATIGMVELILRTILGFIFICLMWTTHFLLMIPIFFVALPIMWIFMIVDKTKRKVVRCSKIGCMTEIKHNLPNYLCPKCGIKHTKLRPGMLGMFISQCVCGKTLPTSSIMGRDELSAFCPQCDSAIVALRAEKFAIQLIGGTSTGKTSYLAAFQHLYREAAATHGEVLRLAPPDLFEQLEENYQSGYVLESTSGGDIIPYHFMHSFSKVIEDFQFDIYDVPGEVITQQTFSSQPEAFRYCDGLIFMIDPLSVESVRAELEQDGEIGAIENYSTDNVAQTFDMFIAQFKALNGLRANEMSDIPVSIIISKTDVKVVKREIGRAKIRTEFKKNPQKYNNESSACDAICREYLCDILNLGNIVSNVEASFRNIKFFPVSAMGHTASMTEPAAYEPIGVIEPVAWIAKTTRAKNGHLLNSAKTGGGLS